MKAKIKSSRQARTKIIFTPKTLIKRYIAGNNNYSFISQLVARTKNLNVGDEIQEEGILFLKTDEVTLKERRTLCQYTSNKIRIASLLLEITKMLSQNKKAKDISTLKSA